MARYTRKKNVVTDTETKEVKKFKYNNEAKRYSRQLQMEADKALGRGTVEVIK